MIRALLFGGAFNPPTKAHIELAEFAMKETGSEKVIFVPSKQTYIRNDQGKNYAFTDAQRLQMLNKIAAGREWMIVSDYELNLPEQPRTYITLCHMREEGYACSLLFGSDKLGELNGGWKYIDEICSEFGIVCMARAEDDCEEMIENDDYLRRIRNFITVVHTPAAYRNVSSTQVREAFQQLCKARKQLNDLLPAELDSLLEYTDIPEETE